MVTCDLAGGIGTSSRVFPIEGQTFTLGALALSNFGRLVNLTVDGRVVGRELDALYDPEERRRASYGSAIVVLATDVPLLSHQLGRIAKRAALGLGRVGSHAASTSGEIVVAFSIANRVPRAAKLPGKFRTLRYVPDAHIDLLYEAAVESTEEAVLNAVFCSGGMDGRSGRRAPALPQERVIELLRTGRPIHARD
jgi:L-aminopeptidase/D-esterase-like protein